MKKEFLSTVKKEEKEANVIVKVEYINKKKTVQDKTYYEILLKDKTGSGKSNIFQDEIKFKKNDVLSLKVSYDKKWNNYKSSNIKVLKKDEYNEDDIGKTYSEDIDSVVSEIKEYINKVDNILLKSILNNFYDDKDFINKLKEIPDTLFSNNNYNGGTLEKHLRVLKSSIDIVENFKNNYDEINMDLIISGSLLISISKNIEFNTLEIDGEHIIEQTDISILVDSNKLSLYKIMELGKILLKEKQEKQEKIINNKLKPISQSIDILKEEEKILLDNKDDIIKNNNEETFDKKYNKITNDIKDSETKKIKIDNELNELIIDLQNDNVILLKLIHIISTQGYYFHQKSERENFPKFIEAQIISLSVHNSFYLSTFLNEFNNLKNVDDGESHIYSNKLNNVIYKK